MPRVQSSEQRHDAYEPFGGLQKKTCRRIGEVCDERLARETGRLFEHVREEENKKKNMRATESSGDGKPSASPSGSATAEE